MNPNEITEKVHCIVKQTFNVHHEITAELQQKDVETWDSLGHLRLFMALEQTFSMKFSIDDIMTTHSVEDIIALIQKKRDS